MVKSQGKVKNASLIATLGTEPQVITASFDLIQAHGGKIIQVKVIHTYSSNSPIEAAIQRLETEFKDNPALASTALQMVPIMDAYNQPLRDVETRSASEAAFRTLYKCVHEAKQAEQKVHLVIAGGRKSMAVFGMAAAQMLFDEDDRLWHLYSAGEFLKSRRLHPAEGDDVQLIPIPVILWSSVSPVFTHLKQVDDPFKALERINALQLVERTRLAEQFVTQKLTTQEEKAVALLVQKGMTYDEIARKLHKSERTVEQQLRSAYQKAGEFWELDDVDGSQLIILLNIYYSTKIRENPQDKRGKKF